MNTELDLAQLFAILKRRTALILACTVLLGLAAYLISAFAITPQYSAKASMYVYNGENRTETITSTDLATSQKLVQTYIVILTSNSVLDEVSKQLGGSYHAEDLRKRITASAINGTEAFEVTVTDPDPAEAQRIVNTIVDIAPAEIIRVVKAGSVEVIDYATLPTAPSSPDVLRNTVIGALIGCALAVGYAVVAALLDTAIHTEEELTTAFTIPVLGAIPTIEQNGNEVSCRAQ